MTTHDFRPGDVVEWGALTVTVTAVNAESVCVEHEGAKWWNSPSALKRIPPLAEGAEHPSRSRAASSLRAADPVDHPAHYTDHPSGVECITVTEHMNFNVGNAVKYLWRAGRKGDALTDLRKAAWYVNREIERLTREAGS